jgi:hypothetical protein
VEYTEWHQALDAIGLDNQLILTGVRNLDYKNISFSVGKWKGILQYGFAPLESCQTLEVTVGKI